MSNNPLDENYESGINGRTSKDADTWGTVAAISITVICFLVWTAIGELVIKPNNESNQTSEKVN